MWSPTVMKAVPPTKELYMISIEATKMIKRHEGLRLKPYRCSAGKLTIGYGRNLDDVGISEEEAEYLLEDDVGAVINGLEKSIKIPWNILDRNRRIALIDLGFNLGITKLLKFKKMLKALRKLDYKTAAKELLDSRYAKQVPTRAKEIAKIIGTGELRS